MSKYRKRSGLVEAITFDELVQHGIEQDADLVRGMPWHFKYNGLPITHENDNCYLIPSPTGRSLAFNRGDMLVTCGDNSLFPMSLASFCMYYERAEEVPTPPPPEQECEHRKLTYCHSSSLWVCAECDEGFNADEFRSQFMEPPEEGMTIANDGASELGKLMREQRQGGPVPDHI